MERTLVHSYVFQLGSYMIRKIFGHLSQQDINASNKINVRTTSALNHAKDVLQISGGVIKFQPN